MRNRSENPRIIAEREGISRQAVYKSLPPEPEPSFDSDGYPTDETILVIKSWNVISNYAIKGLLKYIERAWRYKFPIRKGGRGRDRWIQIATMGWSGNESLIDALQENRMFWAMCWLESRRGGSYKFKTNPFNP